MTDSEQLVRLTAGAPSGDELVQLLVEAFDGCDPDEVLPL